MDVTKPYEFIGFGAIDVTKPYEFIGFGETTGGQSGTNREPTGNRFPVGSRMVPDWFPSGSRFFPERARRAPISCGRPASAGLTTGSSPGPPGSARLSKAAKGRPTVAPLYTGFWGPNPINI